MRCLLLMPFVFAACGVPSENPGGGRLGGERVFPEPGAILPADSNPGIPQGPTLAPVPKLTATATLVGSPSDPSQIRFVFDHTVAGEANPNGGLPALVTVTPQVDVDLSWVRSDTLVVRPVSGWPDATRVEVNLTGLRSTTQSLVAPVAASFVADPLEVQSSAGSMLYPTWLAEGDPLTIWFNHPLPLPSAELIRLDVANSREDLAAGKTTPVKIALAVTEDQRVLRINLPGAPEVGHWYRLTVSKDLRAQGPEPLGKDWVSIMRGPEPLAVTGFSCGWPNCTTEDTWTVNFNGEPDHKALSSCFTITPALELDSIRSEGWSVVIDPRNPREGVTYELALSTRCRDLKGQPLLSPYAAKAVVTTPHPRLSMVTGTGFMAPSQGRLAIAVDARHTPSVDIGVRRVAPEDLTTFLKEHLDDWSGLALEGVEVVSTSRVENPRGKIAVDLDPALVDGRGLVLARVRSPGAATDEELVRTALVQVTDLGLVVKSGPQDTLVWVTSLTDKSPVAGVTIELVNREGVAIWQSVTDDGGLATGAGAPADEDDTRSGRVIVAKRGNDVAFLDLRSWQNRSDPYDFDLSYDWNPKSDVVRGQVFTERGVYRAGETVHIKGFARLDRGRALEAVKSANLRVKVTDSRGNTVHNGDAALGDYGDFDLAFELSNEAPLGAWRITAEAGETDAGAPVMSGSLIGNFRVEAYRPNTFEVKLGELALEGATLSARVAGRYFSGAAMANNRVRWWVTASRASFAPAGYNDFVFEADDSASHWWEPSETSVPVSASGQGVSDKDGVMLIDAALGDTWKQVLSSGPKNLLIEAEVTDVDEQTITGRESLRVESADAYLGVKLSKRFAGHNEVISAQVVGLTPAGQLVEPRRATLTWFRRNWTHRYEDVAGGGREWVSRYEDTELFSQDLSGLGRGPVEVALTVKGSGTFVARVTGEDSQGRAVAAQTELYAWGDGATWSEAEGRLNIIEERPTWRVGETARYIVQSPYPEAKALITIERSGIIERRVVDLVGTAPVVEVPVTADMAPNAYVSFVLLGRASLKADQPAGDTTESPLVEMRMGYARLKVDTADQRLNVSVAPEQERYRPGQRATIKVGLNDAQGKPVAGQVTLMVVDEGVLSLTGYRTPDPHAAIYTERPLSVTTSDARKSLWQRLAADEGMKSDWGGGGEGGEPQNYRSAFATTAAFLPHVIVPESGETEVSFDLPDNLTRFRVMAVAATRDGRFGSSEGRIEVNKPLMVRPALPRFVSVGDIFDARSVVTRLEGQGPVAIELSVSGPVELMEAAKKDLEVGTASTPITFKIKATAPGEARLRVTAVSQGETDAFEVPLTVQWPATRSQYTTTGWLAGNQQRETFRLEIPSHVRADTGGLSVSVANSRINELMASLNYLLEYPYGCVEQTTGGTLPLLALNELLGGFELPGITREAVLKRARAGLERLRTMQTWSGGLSYWPGQTTPHPWGSAYAGLAFAAASRVEALSVPSATLDGLKGYLRDVLRGQAAAGQEEWRQELDQVKPLAAYVLAQLGAPEVAFHAQMFGARAALPDFGKLLVALAIDESKGDRAMVDTLLDEVLAHISADQSFARLTRQGERYYPSTMDSDMRNNALLVMALERVRPHDPLIPKLVAAMMADRKEGHWGNTQDNAFAILALAGHFIRTEATSTPSTVKVLLDGKVIIERRFEGKGFAPASIELPMAEALAHNGKLLEVVREGGDGPIYWTLGLEHAPAEIPRRAVDRGLRLDRRYVYAEGDKAGELATEVKAGDLIKVELTLESDKEQRYIAIDDPLPAGFEPVLLTLATTRAGDLTPDDGRSYGTFSHTEQRDDRVNLFADWLPGGSHSHTYLVRATTRGSFIAPAAMAHAMYSPEVAGRSDAAAVVVQ